MGKKNKDRDDIDEVEGKKAKKNKGDKKDKGGFAKPSDATGGDSWKLTADENVGKLLLITPLRKDTATTEKYGEKEIIVADVVELNENKPAKSELHEEVYVFGAWLQGSLRSFIGKRKVLARLAQVKDSSSGRGYVWKFEDADDDDAEVAQAYIDSIAPKWDQVD